MLYKALRIAGVATPGKNKLIEASKYTDIYVAQECQRIFAENSKKVNEERKSGIPISVSFDEQHQRTYRQKGSAPAASATILGPDAEILTIAHADADVAAGLKCKDKGKASRQIALTSIATQLKVIDIVVGDGCGSGEKSFSALILPKHPACIFQRDVWHVTKGVRKSYKVMIAKRPKAYAKVFICPKFQENIHPDKLSRHFTHSIEQMAISDGDEKVFKKVWLGGLDHWAKEYRIDFKSTEYKTLHQWFQDQCQELTYVAHNKTTSHCEAFHAVAAQYCPKNLSFGYPAYCARKNLAAIHWHNKVTLKCKTEVWKRRTVDKILFIWSNSKKKT